MKLLRARLVPLTLSTSLLLACGAAFAQNAAMQVAANKHTFREILASMDINHNGKLGVQECVAAAVHKNKLAVDCRYWDANGNGIITEEEYVKRVMGIEP